MMDLVKKSTKCHWGIQRMKEPQAHCSYEDRIRCVMNTKKISNMPLIMTMHIFSGTDGNGWRYYVSLHTILFRVDGKSRNLRVLRGFRRKSVQKERTWAMPLVAIYNSFGNSMCPVLMWIYMQVSIHFVPPQAIRWMNEEYKLHYRMMWCFNPLLLPNDGDHYESI